MKAWLARGPGPQATRWRTTSRSLEFGTAGAHQLQDGVDHALADRQAAHQRLGRHQVGRRQRLGWRPAVVAPVVPIMIWRSAASSG